MGCRTKKGYELLLALAPLVLISLLSFSTPTYATHSCAAGQQCNVSWGPGAIGTNETGYGWQEVLYNFGAGNIPRLTGSADRRWYDYGHKPIQLSGRREDYWSTDSGWYYVRAEGLLNFSLYDASGDRVYRNLSVPTSKGRATITYPWNASDDDPGVWRAEVDNVTVRATFYLFVRGKLNVTTIVTSPATVDINTNVVVNASLYDNAQNAIRGNHQLNNGTSAVPSVYLFVTGPSGDVRLSMSDGDFDGWWNASVSFSRPGDHRLIVAAGDNHGYWLDGRNSTWLYVNASVGYVPDYATDYASLGMRLLAYLRSELPGKLARALASLAAPFKRGDSYFV